MVGAVHDKDDDKILFEKQDFIPVGEYSWMLSVKEKQLTGF